MKNIISKTALIFLTIVLTMAMLINSYMLFVMIKLSTSRGFESIKVLAEYKVFSRIWIATSSMSLTMILLVVLMFFVVREIILKSRKRYYIDATPEDTTPDPYDH